MVADMHGHRPIKSAAGVTIARGAAVHVARAIPSEAPPMTKALPFRVFDECRSEPPKAWAIKGVIALDEDSTWFGAPGSMKSGLLTDIAVHLASGRDWRGYRTKAPCGVAFFCMERAGLTRRRLAAYAVRDNLAGLPIAVVDRLVDLLDPESPEQIAETVKDAEARFGCPVGFVVLDTWSKAVAAGMADEDKAQHVNVAAANLKRVHEEIAHPIHIATIGHTGKDEARGERGSNAKLGHVDLAVQIKGGRVRTATVVKANDQSEGVLTSFAMQEIMTGVDEDGGALAVGILSAETLSIVPAAKRSARQDIALNALDKALADNGQEPPAGADLPPVKVVRVEAWRDELFRCGVLERDAGNPRSAFKRLKDGLCAADQIVERDGFVWPMAPGALALPMIAISSAAPLPPPPC
jgi:hypothetical protein